MTQQELYQHIADKTGEDIETIESYGFALCEPDRKELKRQRRLRQWRRWAKPANRQTRRECPCSL